jgi:hypothetical protein
MAPKITPVRGELIKVCARVCVCVLEKESIKEHPKNPSKNIHQRTAMHPSKDACEEENRSKTEEGSQYDARQHEHHVMNDAHGAQQTNQN